MNELCVEFLMFITNNGNNSDDDRRVTGRFQMLKNKTKKNTTT